MVSHKQALIPQLINLKQDPLTWNLAAVLTGVLLIAGLAQISIPLPWTPVPVTGQTFGVALVSLLWGRTRAVSTVTSYLILGFAGLPIFAMGKSGFVLGPTSGYLFGMCAASLAMGTFADYGFARRFRTAWLSALVGSAIVFSCGLIGLSFFVPNSQLMNLGLLPFLPGDLIKTSLAAWLVSRSQFFQPTRLEASNET